MMRPVLKRVGKEFGIFSSAYGVLVSGALINALYWAEGTEVSRPDRAASSLMASEQTKETSAVLGAVLTLYKQGCMDKDSFSRDVTFEDPAVKCKGFGEVKEALTLTHALTLPMP